MGHHDREKNKTIGTKQSLLVQVPYLGLLKRRMTCSQDEKGVIKTNIGFFDYGFYWRIVRPPHWSRVQHV